MQHGRTAHLSILLFCYSSIFAIFATSLAGVFSLLTIRSELLFKAFGLLNKEILVDMSILSNKIFGNC